MENTVFHQKYICFKLQNTVYRRLTSPYSPMKFIYNLRKVNSRFCLSYLFLDHTWSWSGGPSLHDGPYKKAAKTQPFYQGPCCGHFWPRNTCYQLSGWEKESSACEAAGPCSEASPRSSEAGSAQRYIYFQSLVLILIQLVFFHMLCMFLHPFPKDGIGLNKLIIPSLVVWMKCT